jgi:glycerol-3-phosphate dehydrogenase (NAD(P)+)
LARRHGLQTPLFETIHDVIHEGKSPLIAVDELMSRPPREEFFP